MPAGLASGLPTGWEWDYDGTRWFYIFKANGHIQYHFPSEGDEFPDFIDSCEPAPDLNPEERLESHQQVKRVTGVAPVVERKKKKKKAENGMTATARPVGIEWDGDVGEGSSSEEEGKKAVFQPENLMFLGPQTYAEVSPLNEDEDEAAKRTVVGVVKGAEEGQGLVVSPAETTSAGTPAANKAELVRDVEKRSESGRNEAADVFIVSEAVVMVVPDAADEKPTVIGEQRAVEQAKPVDAPVDAPVQQESASTAQTVSSLAQQESKSVAQPASSSAQQDAVVSAVAEAAAPSPPPPPPPPHHEPTPQQHATPVAVDEPPQCYELPAPDAPFNPVGVIAEMPTEDTPRSHIEINPIPVEIMDASVLAPIERVAPLGVAELPASADAVVKQTLPLPTPQSSSVQQQQQQQQRAPPLMQMKIKRKPTDPNASIPSPMSASSSAVMSPAIVSPPSAASPSPASAPASTTPPLAPPAGAPAAPQYRPYAPVSPLHRAATEPVSVPAATRQQQALAQSATAPPSPVANPQLNYAPTVLRPAGQSRKSLSVSPERKHDDDVDGGGKRREATGQLTVAPTGGPVVPNETPNKAAASVPPRPMHQQGQVPPLGQAPAQVQIIPQGQMLSQAAASQQGQSLQPGQMPPHQHIPSQGQTPPQWQVPQNAMHLPAQHGRPMSMAPGQYPPVPIPQPYGQYQHQAPPMSQQPRPPWMAPGQPNPGQNYTTPTPQQQQPPPRWMRQSMPPGPPSGQQPPNARHSMMAQSVPGLAAHGSQYRTAPSLASPPSQPLASHGHRASTPDASAISPLRPRADSQPSGLSLPTPSPMEAPRVPSAAQPAAALPPREQPRRDSVKVGTGSRSSATTPGVKTSTADSYFPPSKEHPVGLVGNIADQFAAEMQAILGSSSATSRAAPVANAAAEAKPEPKSLAGTPSPAPGFMLGRIEEHEAETISVSESSKQDSRPSSVATKLTQPSSHPSTAQLQPQQPTPSQQSSPENTPQPPHGFLTPMNGQPGVAAPGSAAGTTPPGQMIPPGLMYPMPPQGLVPQQQWQGNMQRPSSVPPQMHMQPNKGKENKWTKWFKSSKPEKNPGAPQSGIQQQQQQPPPQGWGQPQQWQPGPPMPGPVMQRPPMQGQPIQRQSMHGPIPGQPIPGQAMQGQPMQRPLMGGPMPTQNMPTNVYPPHQRPTGPGQAPMPQMMTQPHPLGSHPPQQYMPLQPAQPMQMKPAHGSHMQQSGGPMMQMAPPGGPGSPAPPHMIPSQNLSQLHGQAASPMLPKLMPAPLSLRPKSGAPAGVPGSG